MGRYLLKWAMGNVGMIDLKIENLASEYKIMDKIVCELPYYRNLTFS